MGISAGVAVAGAVYSAYQKDKADKEARRRTNRAGKKLDWAREMWQDVQKNEMSRLQGSKDWAMEQYAPYLEQFRGMASNYGGAANDAMSGFRNLMMDPSQITADPLYQAKLASGTRSIENSGAARGMQLSGANLLDLGNFGAELQANTMDQRLGQFAQMGQMGQQGLFGGLAGIGNINQTALNYDALLNQALFGSQQEIAGTLGAQAQMQSALALGQLNASATQNAGMMGAVGTGLGAYAGSRYGQGGGQ